MSQDAVLPCADKLAFETKAAAQATGTVSEWRYGGKLTAYKCRYCHFIPPFDSV